MKPTQRKQLQKDGWRVGSAADFLGLSQEEAAYVDLKFSLSQHLRRRREESGITQTKLAADIRSSQSRIAKAEASDPSVSIDLLIRALFATGVSRKNLAAIIAKPTRRARAEQ